MTEEATWSQRAGGFAFGMLVSLTLSSTALLLIAATWLALLGNATVMAAMIVGPVLLNATVIAALILAPAIIAISYKLVKKSRQRIFGAILFYPCAVVAAYLGYHLATIGER